MTPAVASMIGAGFPRADPERRSLPMKDCNHLDPAIVVEFLNSARIRATYGAVAEVIGGIAQGVSQRLGEKRPEASWIVNGDTRLPTGYAPTEMHPLLCCRDEIIRSGADLHARIVAWRDSSLVEKAVRIAVEAHSGQRQKNGLPYVLHPIGLMHAVSGPRAMMVAALHDVVEDSATTLDDLRREGFPEEVVTAVDCLTHRGDEEYDSYLERVAANELAREVKLADLVNNMDITRLPELRDKDCERLRKYHRAWTRLTRK